MEKKLYTNTTYIFPDTDTLICSGYSRCSAPVQQWAGGLVWSPETGWPHTHSRATGWPAGEYVLQYMYTFYSYTVTKAFADFPDVVRQQWRQLCYCGQTYSLFYIVMFDRKVKPFVNFRCKKSNNWHMLRKKKQISTPTSNINLSQLYHAFLVFLRFLFC